MTISKINSIDLTNILKNVSELFDISNKDYFCFGIDYSNIEPIIQEKFLDDGDFSPEWLIFIINIISEIIKSQDASGNVILIRDNSVINKLKNIKFKTISLRLDDFTDIGFKYIEYELGFFVVWGLKDHNTNMISNFSGLITPFADGGLMLCIGDSSDDIFKYMENKLNK